MSDEDDLTTAYLFGVERAKSACEAKLAAVTAERDQRRRLNRCRQARCRWFLPIGPRCGHKAVHVTEQKGKFTYGYCPDCKDVAECPEGKATNE